MRLFVFLASFVICIAWTAVAVSTAHGIVGDRFFPPTLTTDDPFAVDELSLPSLSLFANPGDGSLSSREIDAGFEFDKEILPNFSLGVSDTFISIKTPGVGTSSGLANLEIIAKYVLWTNARHEAIFSVGLKSEIGGTGNPNIGAASFSTFTPNIYFGKGFGDLGDSLGWARPIAITGQIGQSFPTSAADPNNLVWGFALEYSLPYLQQHVKDVGLPAPLKNMIPLVEFSMQTAENRGQGGITTGTINPGVLWETPDFQIGAEALIPINSRTGPHIGAIVTLQIYIDDLFPKLFGHPLFGE
jgi:hypothetical protein